MTSITVGIGEYKICSRPDEELKTYGLGSCIAITMYDKFQRIAGMLHVAYPESSTNSKKAKDLPGYFVDTGLPIFLGEMKKLNVQRKDVWVNLIGGASIMDENERFNIGKRNILAVKRTLWKAGLGVLKEDTGGVISRTVSISAGTGEVTITSGAEKWKL